MQTSHDSLVTPALVVPLAAVYGSMERDIGFLMGAAASRLKVQKESIWPYTSKLACLTIIDSAASYQPLSNKCRAVIATEPVTHKPVTISRSLFLNPDVKICSFTFRCLVIVHQHWTQLNPISSVRQSAKRLKTPDILSLSEMQTILSRIESQPVRAAILIAAVTGLRRSEIRGLKWGDVDFDGLWIRTKRGKIGKVESRMKTEASRKPTPIPGELGQALSAWREQALYRADADWVFASEANGGREPMWFDILLERHIRVAAEGAGIIKNIGWHTFRRSLATLLAAKKEDVKVVQELMRHANSKITIELYQQGNEDAKRNAQTHVTGLFEVKKPAA
jgi:integrase